MAKLAPNNPKDYRANLPELEHELTKNCWCNPRVERIHPDPFSEHNIGDYFVSPEAATKAEAYMKAEAMKAAQSLAVEELKWMWAGFHSEDALSREELIDALERRIAHYRANPGESHGH